VVPIPVFREQVSKKLLSVSIHCALPDVRVLECETSCYHVIYDLGIVASYFSLHVHLCHKGDAHVGVVFEGEILSWVIENRFIHLRTRRVLHERSSYVSVEEL